MQEIVERNIYEQIKEGDLVLVVTPLSNQSFRATVLGIPGNYSEAWELKTTEGQIVYLSAPYMITKELNNR